MRSGERCGVKSLDFLLSSHIPDWRLKMVTSQKLQRLSVLGHLVKGGGGGLGQKAFSNSCSTSTRHHRKPRLHWHHAAKPSKEPISPPLQNHDKTPQHSHWDNVREHRIDFQNCPHNPPHVSVPLHQCKWRQRTGASTHTWQQVWGLPFLLAWRLSSKTYQKAPVMTRPSRGGGLEITWGGLTPWWRSCLHLTLYLSCVKECSWGRQLRQDPGLQNMIPKCLF